MATEILNKKQDSFPKQYTYNQHMRELIKEISTLHKIDGYDKFEQISMFLREKNTKLNKKKCPICNQVLEKRNGRYGEFWGCAGYPECRYTENI